MDVRLTEDTIPAAGLDGFFLRPLTWGDSVRLGELGDAERLQRVVELCLVDAQGNAALTQGEAAELPMRTAMRIVGQINAVNGVDEDQVQAAEGN